VSIGRQAGFTIQALASQQRKDMTAGAAAVSRVRGARRAVRGTRVPVSGLARLITLRSRPA
jgi:hypothetical protein